MSKTTNKLSPEVRERAVRLVLDTEGQQGSRWQAIVSIAAKIGCSAHALNDWVKKAEIDSGRCAGIPAELAEKMKALEREPRVAPGERDPAQGQRVFCYGGARPPVEVMVDFIDAHRDAHGGPAGLQCAADRPVHLL